MLSYEIITLPFDNTVETLGTVAGSSSQQLIELNNSNVLLVGSNKTIIVTQGAINILSSATPTLTPRTGALTAKLDDGKIIMPGSTFNSFVFNSDGSYLGSISAIGSYTSHRIAHHISGQTYLLGCSNTTLANWSAIQKKTYGGGSATALEIERPDLYSSATLPDGTIILGGYNGNTTKSNIVVYDANTNSIITNYKTVSQGATIIKILVLEEKVLLLASSYYEIHS